MLAAAAILSLVVDMAAGSLYVHPGSEGGAAVRGGVELARAPRPDVSVFLRGLAGTTYAGDWRPIYEATAGLSWRRAIEVHAGLRHDERFRREGALGDFRDPTGRIVLGVSALPWRTGRFEAG